MKTVVRAMRERAVATTQRGELRKFDPEKTRLNDAKLDAMIEYAKKVKEWPLLEEAVEAKIGEQREFVGWWDLKVTPRHGAGRGNKKNAEQGSFSKTKAEEQTGITQQQVSKWRKRLRQPERYARVLFGPSYKKAWGEIHNYQEEAIKKSWPKMIEGEFGLLYADPPWRYDYSLSEQREIENQYPTMELEDIAALKPPAAPDSVLFLWATSPKLKEALYLLEQWQFVYKTCAVWAKDKMGMGYYFRQQHELLLVATRGAPPVPDQAVRPSSVIYAPREEHSKKPVRVYELLESMYPDLGEREKVELFQRTPRKGWSGWPT